MLSRVVLRSRLGSLLFALGIFLGCSRDLNLPDPPDQPGPTELGAFAGYYRMTVPVTVRVGEEISSTAIPVSGTGIIQHLTLPANLVEAAGGDPLVVGLVPPGGLDLASGLELSDGGTTYAMGGVIDGRVGNGSILGADPEVKGRFSLDPLPGAGLALAELDGCPGLSTFEGDQPLYLERTCRFVPSRSGVYAGCRAGCDESCDPIEGPPTHFLAVGFTPIKGQPYDFVVGTSFWTESSALQWTPNLAAGVYDRFQGEGVSLLVDVKEPRPRPGKFSLRQDGDSLDLDFHLGEPISGPGQPPFEVPANTTDVAAYELATACASGAHVRRAVGGLEEACDPGSDPLNLVLFAEMNGTNLGVQVGVAGLGILDPGGNTPLSLLTLLHLAGLRPPAGTLLVPLSSVLQVKARAAPSGRELTRTGPLLCPDHTACFQGLPGLTGVEVQATIRVTGSWSICPDWPETTTCGDLQRVDVDLDIPMARSLPFCISPPGS